MLASGTTMRPVQEAIHARRSIRTFAARPVDRDIVQRLLDAATQAPNHRLTRPWRFFVLDRPGPKREALAQVAADVALRAMPEPHDDLARERARARASDMGNAPVLILAYSVPGRDEHETRENYAAVACGLQNIQLAAGEEGLVGGWSTGGIVRDAAVQEAVGAEGSWEFVGGLYLGYPGDAPAPTRQRPGAADYTVWVCD
jgi:nitroreductase